MQSNIKKCFFHKNIECRSDLQGWDGLRYICLRNMHSYFTQKYGIGYVIRDLRYTMCIKGIYFVIQGMYSEITGPTLPYLKQRVDSNYEQIGRALAARSVGFLTGSLTGGILCDRYDTEVMLFTLHLKTTI